MVSFLLALLSGAICATAGLFIAGFVIHCSLQWHRVSAREGAHGYAIVFGSIACAVVVLILGTVLALIFGGSTLAMWGKGLGIAMAATAGLGVVALAVSYVTSDHPPKIRGKELDLEMEIRTAPGVEVRVAAEQQEVGVFLYAVRRKVLAPPWRRQFTSRMLHWRLLQQGPDQPDAGCVLTCEIPLSSKTRRMLILRSGTLPEQVFALALPARPGEVDMQWTEWKEAQSGKPEALRPEERVQVRYRVRTSPG